MADTAQLVQGTDEWKQARCGMITASRLGDLTARTKSGPSASRKNYIAELVVERLTDEPTELGFITREMQRGKDLEPEARSEYELRYDVSVDQIGFIHHEMVDCLGASPDGLVGDEGTVEIKCPNTAQHIHTIRSGTVEDRYWKQIQGVLACTEREWCDFVSYDPRVRLPGLVLYPIRVERDDQWISEMLFEVKKADAEIEEIIAGLKAKAIA